MKNKKYLILYLISIGLSIVNNIQTGWALSTGRFYETNPLGYNLFTIFMTFMYYIYMLIPFFIKDKSYKKIFSIVIIYTIFIGFYCFVHDFIVINTNKV